MTGREWKPGDVALVSHRLYEDDDTLTSCVRILRSDGKWYGADGWVKNDPDAARSIRPLVVVDPESANSAIAPDEAIRQVIETLRDSDYISDSRIADQIERQWTSKPTEPTGLGAVIEDADGVLWIRWEIVGRHPKPWCVGGATHPNRAYDEIAVAKVLSEGVAP